MGLKILPIVLLMLSAPAVFGQQFSPVRNQVAAWKCHGWVWLSNSNLYCRDAHTAELSRFGATGTQVFPRPQVTAAARHYAVVGLSEDLDRTIYAVDGVNIHVFSSDGKYQKTLTPGIALSGGIAALDSDHIFVTGRVPPQQGPSSATAFLVSPNGVVQSFSDVFVRGLSGLDDKIINFEGHLALDRSRGLLYQVSQNVYEIRVFDLEGKQLRIISPPPQYALKTPRVTHIANGVGLEPGDGIADIAVLPNGGLAIDGELLAQAETAGSKTSISLSRFVDIYSPDGVFVRRMMGAELQLGGAYFTGFDHATGNAFFENDSAVIEAQVR